MIDAILPSGVIAVEAREDALHSRLFPEEELVLGSAVEKRRREFTTARACARTALEKLGFPPGPIPSGERGEPLWPVGAVGSITHCDGYRACAVARSGEILAVGIDAEPNAALPDRLIGDIARPEELPCLHRLGSELPEVHWDRLLFSAKESVYKTWFPLAKRWLGFEDAVIDIDARAGTFAVRLLVEPPRLTGTSLRQLSGRWKVSDGIILTAIVLPASESSDMLAPR